MLQKLFQPSRLARPLACTATSAILLLGLCGCQTSASDITGSLGDKAETSQAADPRRDVETYHERFRANPKDAEAALQYAKALRATGQRAQAVAVLEQATIGQSGQQGAAGGLWAGTGGQRQFPAGLRRARPRP